jgi:hypothetical protein
MTVVLCVSVAHGSPCLSERFGTGRAVSEVHATAERIQRQEMLCVLRARCKSFTTGP